jgi:hypothetical protein
MNNITFEGRIRELESMICVNASMDRFTAAYEALLNDVRALPGPKYERLERMQRLIYRQFSYLFSEWRRERGIKAIQGEQINEIVQ